MANASAEVRNYFKLDHLSGRSHAVLCRLFKNRYTKFYNGAIWDDTSTCDPSFKFDTNSLSKVQQTSIRNGNSKDWDSTTLINLLTKTMQPSADTSTPAYIQQCKEEDQLVEKLRTIRNKLAHLPSKSISNDEFQMHWVDTVKILVALGDDEAELDKVKDNILFDRNERPINELNLTEAKQLYDDGMKAYYERNFDQAATLFIKATVLPGISNHDRAIYYAKLSASRLAQYEQQSSYDFVTFKAKMFLDADDHRYRALQDAKQARSLWSTWWQGHYCVGNAYAALKEYEKAIRSFERAQMLEPNNEKVQEALNEINMLYKKQSPPNDNDSEPIGLIFDPNLMKCNSKKLADQYPAGYNALKGHQYAHEEGNRKPNFEEAAKYYAKASNNGSAEAMYNLAYLTDQGLGVKKDHNLAVSLYVQAANQPPNHPYFKDSRNFGVVEAELALGHRFVAGILIDKDLSQASYWYKRAVEHGSSEAQNYLATLSEDDSASSEQTDLSQNEKIREHPTTTTHPSKSSYSFKPIYKLSGHFRVYDYNVLNEYAEHGWITAQIMRSALEHFFLALSLCIDTEYLTEEQENEFVCELSQCYRLARIVVEFPADKMRQQTIHIVNRVLHRCSVQFPTSTSSLDEDVRICYAGLNTQSNDIIKQSIQKYPKTIFFIELSAIKSNTLGHYETSLGLINRGLQIEPKNWELLYLRAVTLHNLGNDITKALEAYQTFLTIAPKDHRHVPESYYAMGICQIPSHKSQHIPDIVRELYNQGEEAERKQVPCFLPYESENKQRLKNILDQTNVQNNESVHSSNGCTQNSTNSERIEIILKHRTREKQMRSGQGYNSQNHEKPQVKNKTIKSLIGLKSISIKQMDCTCDHIYKEYVLTVTIIEETHWWNPFIQLIIEDEHHDCQELHIVDFPEEKGQELVKRTYTIGSKMHIINPYRKLNGNDRKSIIYVDDFSSIMMLNDKERVLNMCRSCGKSNSQYRCPRCHRAYYCSKNCQAIDWKTCKHELICSL